MVQKACLLSLLAAACACPLFGAEKAQPSSLTSFGAVMEVNVVNVDVYASDKSGKRVNDLRQGDFILLEDGKPVAVTNFTPVRLGAQSVQGSPADSPPGAAVEPRTPGDAWNLVVYVDNSNIRSSHRARVLEQVREFLAHNLSPGDRVMLVTSDLVLKVWQPFTSDPAALDAALQGIGKVSAHGPEIDIERKTAFESMMTIQQVSLADPLDPLPCPLDIARPAHDFASSRRSEVRRSLGALTILVNSLSGVPGRKAVLHVSDGLPAVPGEELFQFLVELCGGSGTSGFGQLSGGGKTPDPQAVYDARQYGPRSYQAGSQAPSDSQAYSVTKDLAALVAHANAHQVTLYTLQASGVSGTEASDASLGPGERLFQFPSIGSALRASLQESLQTLAEGTGGRAILNANDWRPDLAGLREDFSTFYSLGYTPAHNGDGKEHKIEVRVKRPGIRLRYRESYRDKPVLEKAVDRTLAALLYGLEDNPLEIAVEVGEQVAGPSGTIAVPIHLRIPLHKLAILNHEETYEGSLRLLVATRSEDGRSAPVRQVAVPIKIPRKQVLGALGQSYLYTLTLQLPPGTHQVAVGVRDEIGATTSYLRQAVTVAVTKAATGH
ncbi:MAG TPA: VWA domain-containing protein [Thermoanaerobaculia bacterium]|jgi:VWFA-related protein|nr:VWA domain-containing protein [Thermoanaerobaculia bacterium]